MRMVLVGAGSIGGTVAAMLQGNGYPLDVVVHGEEAADQINKEGYYLTGLYGEGCVKLKAFPTVDALEGQYDIAFVATKYQQLQPMATALLPYLKEDSLVVSLQNGLCMDLLADVVGEKRTVGVMISLSGTRLDVNKVNVTAVSQLLIGMPNAYHPKQLDELKKMLNTFIPTEIMDNIVGHLFSKLIFNSCINAIAAVTDTTVGKMLRTKKARQVVMSIIREGCAVAEAMGIEVARFNIMPKFQFMSRFDTRAWNAAWGRFLQLAWLVGGSGRVIPSTLQSLRAKSPTEIDIMNGYLAEQGKQYGIPTPTNQSITEVIKQMEEGALPLSPDNIFKVDCGTGGRA